MRLFRRPAEVDGPTLAFCEPVSATPFSRVHIRLRLGGESPKLGGGIDGPALCGYDVTRGWDLPGDVTREAVTRSLDAETGPSCPDCARRVFGDLP